jgi:hypothetical protein
MMAVSILHSVLASLSGNQQAQWQPHPAGRQRQHGLVYTALTRFA